jgi:hypothetical protein
MGSSLRKTVEVIDLLCLLCVSVEEKRPSHVSKQRPGAPGKAALNEIGTKRLAGDAKTSYSARMQWIVGSVVGAVVLAFCALIYVAVRSWRKIGIGRRIAGLLLLVPHFLLLVCMAISLRVGNAPQGSPRFNEGFAADVYMMFILPVPALLGSIVALVVFLPSRPNRPDAQATSSEHPTLRP